MSDADTKINKDDWQSYFDTFAKRYLKDDQPEYADIKIYTDHTGVQSETTWQILEGITYDEKDDLLNIKVENLNHMILNPREIYVEEADEGWINSVEIIDQDNTKTIIETR